MKKTETIACSHCGEAILCDERHFGTVVQCPHCANNFQVPNLAGPAELKRAKPLAIASMILSLSSVFLGPFGFGPGIVCGHLAMRRARRAETNEGKTFARVGLVVGYLGLTVSILLMTALATLFGKATSTTAPKEVVRASGRTEQKQAAATGNKVEVAFDGFENGFGERAIALQIRNGFPKPVTQLDMVYVYVDAQKKVLKEFSMMKSSNELAPGNGSNRAVSMAPFMPPNTASVEVRLKKVTFADGGEWVP